MHKKSQKSFLTKFCFKQISKRDTSFYIHFSCAYDSLKVNFHGDSVKYESARTKQSTGGGATTPQACLGLRLPSCQLKKCYFNFF